MISKSASTGSDLHSGQCGGLCVRVAVLGPAGVGKTSIIRQFLYDMYQEEYRQTVEEMHSETYEADGVRLTLDILDTGRPLYIGRRDLCSQCWLL